MKVLLVDDNIRIPKALARCFESDGWDVVVVSSVAQAEPVIPLVDVVVTDYEMPDGGGEAVIAGCKEHNKPVVVLTGNDEVKYRHVVYKPTSYSVLRDTIQSAMHEKVA